MNSLNLNLASQNEISSKVENINALEKKINKAVKSVKENANAGNFITENNDEDNVFVFALKNNAKVAFKEENIITEIKNSQKVSNSSGIVIRPINKQQYVALLNEMQLFFKQWKVHGTQQLNAKAFVLLNYFLVVVVGGTTKPSGCAKDELNKHIKITTNKINIELVNSAKVLYSSTHEKYLKEGVWLNFCQRYQVASLVSKEIMPSSLVFNLAIQNLNALENNFFAPAMRGWLASSF